MRARNKSLFPRKNVPLANLLASLLKARRSCSLAFSLDDDDNDDEDVGFFHYYSHSVNAAVRLAIIG